MKEKGFRQKEMSESCFSVTLKEDCCMGRVIIIGNSAAGLSALESFRQYNSTDEVLVISKEGTAPYSRVLLPYILRGKLPYDCLNIREEDYFTGLNAKCVCEEVLHVNAAEHTVVTDRNTYSFDKLLIASGSHAVSPPVKGLDQEGVLHMWTRQDLDRLLPLFASSHKVVVIGSGFIALQAAWAAVSRGLQVTVIELMDRIMPTVLDEKGAEILTQKIREAGVNLMTDTVTEEAEKTADGRFLLHLKDREPVEADFIIVGTGVRSNIEFLKDSGVVTERGIPVDAHLMTNVPDIYAAGDAAMGPTVFHDAHMTHALWPTACEEGRVAGENMAGKDTVYEGSLNMNVTEMFHVTVASMGKFRDSETEKSYLFPEESGYGYLKICYEKNRPVGGCLVGSWEAAEMFGRLRRVIKDIDTDAVPEEIFETVLSETIPGGVC